MILEIMTIPTDGPRMGKMLKALLNTRDTGVRIVGIQRGEQRYLNPAASHVIKGGDLLLVVGTLDELNHFRRWMTETTN